MSISMNILTLSNVWSNSAIRACTWLDVAWLINERISSIEFCIRKRSINWSIHSVLVARRLNSENRLLRRSLSTLAKNEEMIMCVLAVKMWEFSPKKYYRRFARFISEGVESEREKNCCNYERNYRLQGHSSCFFFFCLISQSIDLEENSSLKHVAINSTTRKNKKITSVPIFHINWEGINYLISLTQIRRVNEKRQTNHKLVRERKKFFAYQIPMTAFQIKWKNLFYK